MSKEKQLLLLTTQLTTRFDRSFNSSRLDQTKHYNLHKTQNS